MDPFLTLFVVLAVFALVVAIVAGLRSSAGNNGLLADSSIRYHEREELGLGGFGRSIRSVSPRR